VIVGIVLAAGFGRRIGGPKALLRLDGQTFHDRACRRFAEAGVPFISVVNREVAEALGPETADETRLVNPDPDQPAGMLASARLGLAKAREGGASSAILLPVDHALVATEDVRTVVRALRDGGQIVIPTWDGKRGHPLGLGPSTFLEALCDTSSASLKDVVRRDPSRVVEVPGSPGVVFGVNTKEDLERAETRRLR
jgi:molybdenum cofactor cytidylyltransferase